MPHLLSWALTQGWACSTPKHRELCLGSTAALTHQHISSEPLACTNKRLPSTASQYTLRVLIPPYPISISSSWTTYFYRRRELLYPCCMPQLCAEKADINLAITAQLWTSPEVRDQTAHGNSIHINSQWIGMALESCMHFSEACCLEKIPNQTLK